jgi:hypothetical protein
MKTGRECEGEAMTATEFCYWFQGFIELNEANPDSLRTLTFAQYETVKRHLALVFAHDIDPKAGDAATQVKLNTIHHKNPTGATPRC